MYLSCPTRPCFPGGLDGKESTCNVGDLGSIPGLGRSPGGGHDNPLQYSFLENHMDRGAWWAAVHGVAKGWTWLSDHAQHSTLPQCLVHCWAFPSFILVPHDLCDSYVDFIFKNLSTTLVFYENSLCWWSCSFSQIFPLSHFTCTWGNHKISCTSSISLNLLSDFFFLFYINFIHKASSSYNAAEISASFKINPYISEVYAKCLQRTRHEVCKERMTVSGDPVSWWNETGMDALRLHWSREKGSAREF